MTNARVRWGVLSTANSGRSVNPAIQASSNGSLVAVASRDGDRAHAFAEKWSMARYYGRYEELIADREIDALYIPLPNGLHKEWSIRAMEAGKHVLCEKPLALDAAECRDMERAAGANGVTLMEAFMYRFHPRTEAVIERVRRGSLGTVRAIRSAFTFKLGRPNDVRLVPALGGGALMDVGCYCVNVSRTLAGAEPVEVQAWARWHASGVDAHLTGMLRFPNDVVAHFDCALDLERREFYEVAGTDAAISVDASFVPKPGNAAIIEHRAQREEVRDDVPAANQYLRMVEHFADCALHRRPVRYPASEAAANMAAIDALYRSARAGGATVRLRAD